MSESKQVPDWPLGYTKCDDGVLPVHFMVSTPPSEEYQRRMYAAEYPITTRRIALVAPSPYLSEKDAEAYARLFAAAPETNRQRGALLAALKRAVELYGKPGGPWNVPSEPGSWLSQAREAIAAAEEVR